MQDTALFVEAGYLLAEVGRSRWLTRNRWRIEWDYGGLLSSLKRFLESEGSLIDQVYWYDAEILNQTMPGSEELARMTGVVLRMGRMSAEGRKSGRQEGIDVLMVRDLIVLSHRKEIGTAYICAASPSITEGIREAQAAGVKVFGLSFDSNSRNRGAALLCSASDHHRLIPSSVCSRYAVKINSGGSGSEIENPFSKLGRDLAKKLCEKLSDDELKTLLERRPVIPQDLDSAIMRLGQKQFGEVAMQEATTRREVRKGWWRELDRQDFAKFETEATKTQNHLDVIPDQPDT